MVLRAVAGGRRVHDVRTVVVRIGLIRDGIDRRRAVGLDGVQVHPVPAVGEDHSRLQPARAVVLDVGQRRCEAVVHEPAAAQPAGVRVSGLRLGRVLQVGDHPESLRPGLDARVVLASGREVGRRRDRRHTCSAHVQDGHPVRGRVLVRIARRARCPQALRGRERVRRPGAAELVQMRGAGLARKDDRVVRGDVRGATGRREDVGVGGAGARLGLDRGAARDQERSQRGEQPQQRQAASLREPSSSAHRHYSQRSVRGVLRIRSTRTGTPAATALSGTSFGDDRRRPEHAVVADRGAAQDRHAVADPDVVADADVALVDALLADRAVDLDDAVVEVDQHDAVGDDALTADRDVLEGGDRALLAEHGLRADPRLALVHADLRAVADPRPAPKVQRRVLADLDRHARADEAQAVGLQPTAPAQLQPQPARDQAHVVGC